MYNTCKRLQNKLDKERRGDTCVVKYARLCTRTRKSAVTFPYSLKSSFCLISPLMKYHPLSTDVSVSPPHYDESSKNIVRYITQTE